MTNSPEIYIRDHLLIQFMMEYYLDKHYDIEDIHNNWLKWLKEQEERYAERS